MFECYNKDCLELHSNENDIVFDPFMGSCSTGIACKKLKRKFIGSEIDTQIYNTAMDRVNDFDNILQLPF